MNDWFAHSRLDCFLVTSRSIIFHSGCDEKFARTKTWDALDEILSSDVCDGGS